MATNEFPPCGSPFRFRQFGNYLLKRAARAREPALHRKMQPETHRIENIENSREVWPSWIGRKGTMNGRPRNPRYLRKV